MLSKRDFRILHSIVDLYVRDGAPVSSRRVKDTTGSPLSTATIRSVMARLEREGLLSKPHTSAGRIPTDWGYRSYVDNVDRDVLYDDEFSTRFREELREQDMGVGVIMAAASRCLGSISKNFAVAYGSVVRESRVRRCQLVKLENNRLLVVIYLTPEFERTIVLKLEREFAPEVIGRAETRLNHVVRDKMLPGAKEAIDAAIRDNVTDEGIIAREIAVHREDIFSDPPAVELYFEERGHLLEQPELSDPKLLQLLLRLLHNKQYLTSILADRLGERTCVTIGREHEARELKPFSIVTAGYRVGGSRSVLGIIGPTRMQYDLVRSLVRAVAKEIRAIGEEYF
jgi:heat-inducible transcriptional repressor